MSTNTVRESDETLGRTPRNDDQGNSGGIGYEAEGSQISTTTGNEETAGQASRKVSRFDDRSSEGEKRRASESARSDINDYADWTVGFWFSGKNRPEKESIAIMGLGLAGESGEVVEHLKKFIRDDHIDVTELKKELGDSIYYWCRICKQFGLEPTEVIQANVKKLESRRQRGVLRGDGDNR